MKKKKGGLRSKLQVSPSESPKVRRRKDYKTPEQHAKARKKEADKAADVAIIRRRLRKIGEADQKERDRKWMLRMLEESKKKKRKR